MKVVISIDSVRFPLTGIGRYTYELARHLPAAIAGLDLRFMSGGRLVEHLPDDAGASKTGNAARKSLWLRRILQNSSVVVTGHRALLSMRESLALKGHEDAVFHGPQFYLPEFAGASVVTVHDLSVYSWAHCHPHGRVKMMQTEIYRAIQRAGIVLTDSEFTRREVAAFFSLADTKIRAVPLASADAFAPRSERDLQPVLQRLGLPMTGYCLYSGTIEPRKNLNVLLDAYSRLADQIRRRWPLVLCGYQGWQSAHLHKRIEQAESAGWARYLGYVSGEDLPFVFAGARLFAFPSLYEGFGLPVLEAMASGVPVVCSNSSSLPEVAGNAALMCEPHDVEMLTALLAQGLEDEVWRTQACTEGLAQARRFSWQRCANQTADAYRAALG